MNKENEYSFTDVDGTTVFLNEYFSDTKELTHDELLAVLALHKYRVLIETNMKTCSPSKLIPLYLEWEDIQFQLQDAWYLDLDSNYHRSYLLPQCTCPKYGNEELYGTDSFIYSSDCPIHSVEAQTNYMISINKEARKNEAIEIKNIKNFNRNFIESTCSKLTGHDWSDWDNGSRYCLYCNKEESR